MTLYRWRAVDPRGEVVEGETEALDHAQVIDQLRRQGRLVLRTEPVGRHLLAPGLRGVLGSGTFACRRRLRGREGILLYSGLSALLDAGLPVDRALEVTARLCRRGAPCRIATDLLVRVRAGAGLADAMGALSGVFPDHALRMVQAGEKADALGIVTHRLAEIAIHARLRWVSALPTVASLRVAATAIAYRLPGLGPRLARGEARRLLRGLSVLLANGVPEARALEVMRHASPNPAMRTSLDAAAARMRRGEDLGMVLGGLWWLPPEAAQAAALGRCAADGVDDALRRLG